MSSARATRGTFESDVKDARLVSTLGRRGVEGRRARRHQGRGLHALGQHAHARRSVERVGRSVRQRRRLPDYQPQGALPPVARGAHRDGAASPVLTSLTSAYLPRNVRPQVTSITVHPPGVVFQKPFSSGETEIAGLDDEASDRRNAGATPAGGRRAGAWPAHLPEGPPDLRLEGRRRERRRPDLRRVLPARRRDDVATAEGRAARHPAGVGHLIGAERHLRA